MTGSEIMRHKPSCLHLCHFHTNLLFNRKEGAGSEGHTAGEDAQVRHLLGARLLLSPAISSFLIKGVEGSKYTLAFFGKKTGIATCVRVGLCVGLCGVCVCVFGHRWPSRVQAHPTRKSCLPATLSRCFASQEENTKFGGC